MWPTRPAGTEHQGRRELMVGGIDEKRNEAPAVGQPGAAGAARSRNNGGQMFAFVFILDVQPIRKRDTGDFQIPQI